FFMNDFYGRGITDRNLFLDTVEWMRLDAPKEVLQQLLSHNQTNPSPMMNEMDLPMKLETQTQHGTTSLPVPPETQETTTASVTTQITLEYPESGHQTCFADLVVASVQSSSAFFKADLVIDGQEQNLDILPQKKSSRVILPLLLRHLAPGKHTLSVQIRENFEKSGKSTRSETREFTILESAEKQTFPYVRAVHLLSRFAYGPEPEALAQILIQGERQWLESTLKHPFSDEDIIRQAEQLYPDETQIPQVQLRALHHLIFAKNPVQARFSFWIQNHFSTWIRKSGTISEWEEYVAFSRLGVAPFQDLLFASASSPAMIYYLDQFRSFSNALNENYAREIMELHTVGVHGGYTQTDITALAQLLNGWTLSDEANRKGSGFPMVRFFRHDSDLGQGTALRIFGMDFPEVSSDQCYDRALIMMEMLAGHPATAHFISQKLVEHYIGTPVSEPLVHQLTQQFLSNGGQLQELLLTIAESQDFWKTCDSLRLATPLDFTLRLARLSLRNSEGKMIDCLRNSGMGIFDRVTPDGYPEEEETYVSANALLQRWKFLQQWSAEMLVLIPEQWLTILEEELKTTEVLDLLAIRLTGFPLNSASQEAVLKGLQHFPKTGKVRIEACLLLLGLLPEMQLR
ncbi:MAG: DUF1800 family protein, partial [Planctomycetota bacterium]